MGPFKVVKILTGLLLSTAAIGQVTPYERANTEVNQLIKWFNDQRFVAVGQAAKQPLMVGGSPALIVIAADTHTGQGERETAETLRAIKDHLKFNTQLLEGRSARTGAEAEAGKQIDVIEIRLSQASIMSEAELRAMNLFRPVDRTGFKTPDFPKLQLFEKLHGMESPNTRDFYLFYLRGNLSRAEEILSAEVKEKGECILSVDNKFRAKDVAIFWLTLEALQAEHQEAPKITALLERRTSTDAAGKQHAVLFLGRRNFEIFEKSVREYILTFNVLQRNEIMAKMTRELFSMGDAPRGAAVSLGSSHVIHFTDRPSAKSYTDWLADLGISSVTVLPKGSQGKFTIEEKK